MLSQFQFEPYYPHLEKFLEWPRVLYLEPFSTRSEPFTDFPRQAYSFINDDFCHTKSFTAKIAAKTARSIIKIKESVSRKKTGLQLSDEVKLWFDLPNAGSLYAKVKSNDYLKLHYDHGLRLYNGNYFYFFGGANSSKLLNNVDVRVGLGHVSENSNIENRLKVTLRKEGNQYHWYHKSFLVHQRFRFGFLTVFDLNRNILQKNNLLVGWQIKPDTVGFLRAEVSDFRQSNLNLSNPQSYFDILTGDIIHKINSKSKFGFEASYNIRQNSLGEAKAVYQVEYSPKKIIKTSINNRLDIAFLTKFPVYGLEDIAQFSAGIGINGLAKKEVSFESGFELSINL